MTAKGTGLRPAVISTLAENSDGLSTDQLAERLGTAQKYMRVLLLALKDDGIVGVRRGNRQNLYFLVAQP